MKWQVFHYSEGNKTDLGFTVEAETKEEAIAKAPHDCSDPERRYFSAHPWDKCKDCGVEREYFMYPDRCRDCAWKAKA